MHLRKVGLASLHKLLPKIQSFAVIAMLFQITLRDLEENTEWRRKKLTRPLWGTTTKAKLRSTSHKKVSL